MGNSFKDIHRLQELTGREEMVVEGFYPDVFCTAVAGRTPQKESTLNKAVKDSRGPPYPLLGQQGAYN